VPSRLDIEFAPGQTRAEVLLPLIDDAVPEYIEEFVLRLEPLGPDVDLGRAEAVILILDDD
jgi:hypothetical protein